MLVPCQSSVCGVNEAHKKRRYFQRSRNRRTGHKTYYVVKHSISLTFCGLIFDSLVGFFFGDFIPNLWCWKLIKKKNPTYFHFKKRVTKKPCTRAPALTTRSCDSVGLWIHYLTVTLGTHSGVCTLCSVTLGMACISCLLMCTCFDLEKYWRILLRYLLDTRKKYIYIYYRTHIIYKNI